MNDIDEGIEEMNKAFEEGVVKDDLTEAPPTDPPPTEVPPTDPPPTDAPPTEAPKTEAPTTEVPEEDPEVVELRRKLAEAEEELTRKKEEPSPTSPPPTEAPLEFEDQDFIGDVDLEELTTNPKLLNELLNKAYQKAIVDGRKAVSEKILRSIPEIMKATSAQQAALKATHDKFYTDNEDLKPWKKSVAGVFEDVMAENPGKRYDSKEIMDKVAKETRSRLELGEKAVKKDEKKEDKHPKKLPRKKGSSGKPEGKPKTDSLVDELDEMNESLGRD